MPLSVSEQRFIIALIFNLKAQKLEADWKKVAEATGLKNGGVAMTRWGQIRRHIQNDQANGLELPTPTKTPKIPTKTPTQASANTPKKVSDNADGTPTKFTAQKRKGSDELEGPTLSKMVKQERSDNGDDKKKLLLGSEDDEDLYN
ncbi:MAG: hypothetical protein MMC23_008017 [Stictis urceolatum]|nr:hypothetical protein [Stictis urceolata]